MQKIILPPQCLGIMGGGQLGRMFAMCAKCMGYKIAVLEPDLNCPARQFADYHITSGYSDINGLNELAGLAQVVTTEFENVPAESLEYLSHQVPVYPNHKAVLIAQNRIKEKDFFNAHGISTTKYCPILSLKDINISSDMFPAILKTNCLGYDGKGQIKVSNTDELHLAWLELEQVPCILEKMLDIRLEVSVIVARSSLQSIAYPVVQNIHHNGILDLTIAPASLPHHIRDELVMFSLKIIEKLDYIGVLAIEFFIDTSGNILANEMAPRPHNSGHYSLDACVTSQFEQQIRSICNLAMGNTGLSSNAIMINLLGDIWPSPDIHPQWGKILTKHANLKLHLYEKLIAKPGRKMGHLTILGKNKQLLKQQARQIKQDLGIAY